MRVGVAVLAAACALSAGLTTAEAHHFDSSGNIRWQDADRDWSEGRRSARSDRARGRRHARDERPYERRRARDDFEGRSDLGAGMRFSGVGPRPRQWCGWWMRTQRGGGPEFNVAWNWRSYGSPASPQVGAVVVWRHHVGEIVGRASNGQWIVRSGNDGGAVRTRARSVAGAVFRI
ncbi:MAG: hypothetical protein K2X43_23345 [Hyphomonadaceae bacterium]|nr:hypothetical protein [Hyphomonadaceae bacterium]